MASIQDRIVRELDVYVSGFAEQEGHQAYLIQYPLRPPWRPYSMDDVDQIAVKLKAQQCQG